MQDQTPLVLLATEGARCTEAAGGQVAAPAPAAPTQALLALLGLPAYATPAAVRAALNKKNWIGRLPIHRALGDEATGPELVRAMLDAGGEAMLGVPDGYELLPLHRAASN